jgi:hypothetical protein
MCKSNSHFIFSLAVVTALKSLQEKIRKLELDRSHAKANLEQLSSEAKQYQEKLEEERRQTTPRSQPTSPSGIELNVSQGRLIFYLIVD